MFQVHELKHLSSIGEVLGLLTAIITLSNYLTNPFPPKYQTGVTNFIERQADRETDALNSKGKLKNKQKEPTRLKE